MTQLEFAKKGIPTHEMKQVAQDEKIKIEDLLSLIAKGEIVIPKNVHHRSAKATGIGRLMRIKVNANIGTSQDLCDIAVELEKLKACITAGADAVMDLSTGGDLKTIRAELLKNCTIPLGTVPIYETVVNITSNKFSVETMTADDIFNTIEAHAQQGVDFVTVHCGVTQETIRSLIDRKRILDMVSRGGTLLAAWMLRTKKENPLFEDYDRLLDIAYKYDMTLSLGDGMRPGCVSDATDTPQIHELITLGKLAKRAFEKNVQVMIEGPGHMPLNQIAANMQLEKTLCHNAPFYVLGPLVTDVAPGYDHITAAIGGTLAAMSGADFLCYVTAAEHLKLPDIDEVREGVIVSRIAAHAADIAKGIPGAIEWDNEMAKARKNLDWEKQIALAIDSEKARKMRASSKPKNTEVCTMCGDFCAIKELKCALNETKKVHNL